MTIAAPERITMYGTAGCSDCRRSRALLDARGVDYDYVDLERSAEATERAREIGGRTSTPVLHFPDGSFLVEPSDQALLAKLAAD